jgi:hypothetical protein
MYQPPRTTRRRRPARNPDQPPLFVLPNDADSVAPPMNTWEAFDWIKDLGDEAQDVRAQIFVDRPATGKGYERQARRAHTKLLAYLFAWEELNRLGLGDTVAEIIEWHHLKRSKTSPQPPAIL